MTDNDARGLESPERQAESTSDCPFCGTAIGAVVTRGPSTHTLDPCGCPISTLTARELAGDLDRGRGLATDGGTSEPVSEFLVRDVLNRQLEERPETCPVCSGAIGTTISTMHDRECVQCGTKFTLDAPDAPRVDLETTPPRRIEKRLRQKATETAVLNELGGGAE